MFLTPFEVSELFNQEVTNKIHNVIHVSNNLYIGSTSNGIFLLDSKQSSKLVIHDSPEFQSLAYFPVSSILFCLSTNQNLLSVYELINDKLTLLSNNQVNSNNAQKLFFSNQLNILFLLGDTLQLYKPDLTFLAEIEISPLYVFSRPICIDEFQSAFIIFQTNSISKYSDQGACLHSINTKEIKLYTYSRSSIFVFDCENTLTKYDFNLKEMAKTQIDDFHFIFLSFIQSSFLLFISNSINCYVYNFEINQMFEIGQIPSIPISFDFSFESLSLIYDHQIISYKININWQFLQKTPLMIDIIQKNSTLIGFNSNSVIFLNNKGTNIQLEEIRQVHYINHCLFALQNDGKLFQSTNGELTEIPHHSKQKTVYFCFGTFPGINEKVIYAATQYGKLLIFNSLSYELLLKIKLHENSPQKVFYSISRSVLIVVSNNQLSLFDTLAKANYDMTEMNSKIILSSYDNEYLVLYHEDLSLSLFTFKQNREMNMVWNIQLSTLITFLKMDFNYIIYIVGRSIVVMNVDKEKVEIQLPFELVSASFADFDLIVSTRNSLLIKIERHHFKSILPKDDEPPQIILRAPPGTPTSQHFNRARVCRSAQSSSSQNSLSPIVPSSHSTQVNSPRNLSPISSRILPPPKRKSLVCPRPSPIKH